MDHLDEEIRGVGVREFGGESKPTLGGNEGENALRAGKRASTGGRAQRAKGAEIHTVID